MTRHPKGNSERPPLRAQGCSIASSLICGRSSDNRQVVPRHAQGQSRIGERFRRVQRGRFPDAGTLDWVYLMNIS